MKAEESEIINKIKEQLVFYDNFPKPNVKFCDVFPVVGSPQHLELTTKIFADHLEKNKIHFDKIFMLDSRGFLFAVPLSLKTNKPSYPVRKKGKLPGDTEQQDYGLQYGKDVIEIQKHTIKQGDKVIIVDDILATGGTINAAISLIQKLGGVIEQVLFFSIIAELDGLSKIKIPKQKVFYIIET